MDQEPPEPDAADGSMIVHGDGLRWLHEHPAAASTSVITSLPDVSELPALGFAAWRDWFIDAARQIIRWVPEDSVAIFYQSDVRHAGRWVDKAYLVQRAAEDEQAALVWHKIVCRSAAGTTSWGRATYSHMLCFTRGPVPALRSASADVLPTDGGRDWTRGMGRAACQAACLYIQTHTPTRTIVDPFCGRGLVLAIARTLGFEVVGVELTAKRCRAARTAIREAAPLAASPAPSAPSRAHE